MYTSTILPTYFQITWDGTSFNNLTGDASGGLDSVSAERINRQVWMTGNTPNPTVTPSQSFLLNNTVIVMTGTSLASASDDINSQSTVTGVVADISSVPNYLTLVNAPGHEGEPIWIGSDPGGGTPYLDLGFEDGSTWKSWPSTLGTGTVIPNNGDTVAFNGRPVTFSSALGLSPEDVANTINQLKDTTNVVARVSAGLLQLASADGQPYTVDEVTSGALGRIGLTASTQAGVPTSLTQSLAKTRANMRWRQIQLNLSNLASPVYYGNPIVRSNPVNSAAPVTTLTWIVGYDRVGYLNVDGLEGADAIRRVIAGTLASEMALHSNERVFDPTLLSFGDNVARGNPNQILGVVAAPLATGMTALADLEAAITVVQLV